MLFSSITFLYLFLPWVVVLYYLVPRQGKNQVLLAASLVFYGWGEPRFLGIMVAEILCGYVFGLLLGRYREKAPGKFILGASLCVNLGLLGYFKYAGFLLETLAAVTRGQVQLLQIALPIGISFYTFQLMSYTIDVYRGTVRPQRNLLTLATYVVMFPQLIAGPIVRYADVEQQLKGRIHSFEKAALGIRRFMLGLGKKVLLANALGELCEIFRDFTDLSVSYYWLYGVAFTLHIYYDFSGYSDMAIGLGKIFGFDFLENFQYPYSAKSITEFWRRWHISLGRWFRDYVYIPLGGNRVSKGKWLRNVLLVWFLTGFWHGAAWQFILWGLFFGLLLILEKFFLKERLEKAKIWNHLYVMLCVVLGFVLFHAENLTQAMGDFKGMFGFGHMPLVSAEALYYLRSYGGILSLAILGATPLPKRLIERLQCVRFGEPIVNILEVFFLFGLLILVTAYLVDGSFNPFLYFRF